MTEHIPDTHKLVFVKPLHTLIWLFYNVTLAYMFYTSWTGQIGILFWIGMTLIGLECIILYVNNWTCPLTPIARRYADDVRDNFDIYPPNWLARNSIIIYTILFIILIIIYFIK